jgi:hypothetical protein
MLGRFNELADAAKTFAGSALTEFSQALDAETSDPDRDDQSEPISLRPVDEILPVFPPPSLVTAAAATAMVGPSFEAVEAMREAHRLELLRLKAVLQAVQEEGEVTRCALEMKLAECQSEISSLQTALAEKDGELENLSLLLSRCVAEKSKLILEKDEQGDLVDGKILRPLFIQLADVRNDSTQHLQTLHLIADVLKLSDHERLTARLTTHTTAAESDSSLAVQFISFLTADLAGS